MQYNVADEEWSKVRRMTLDRVDLSILATLAKDCRTSYSSVNCFVDQVHWLK